MHPFRLTVLILAVILFNAQQSYAIKPPYGRKGVSPLSRKAASRVVLSSQVSRSVIPLIQLPDPISNKRDLEELLLLSEKYFRVVKDPHKLIRAPHDILSLAIDGESSRWLYYAIAQGIPAEDAFLSALSTKRPFAEQLLAKHPMNLDNLLLRAAGRSDLFSAIDWLLKHKADPNITDPETGQGALHRIVQKSLLPEFIAKEFKKAHANFNLRDAQGNTPLHVITVWHDIEMLLKCGADPTIRNAQGRTPEEEIIYRLLNDPRFSVNFGCSPKNVSQLFQKYTEKYYNKTPRE